MIYSKIKVKAWHMPVIPAIQEAEIGRITVQSYPKQKVSSRLSMVVHSYNASYRLEDHSQRLAPKESKKELGMWFK
jgi:hypothetical protein